MYLLGERDSDDDNITRIIVGVTVGVSVSIIIGIIIVIFFVCCAKWGKQDRLW